MRKLNSKSRAVRASLILFLAIAAVHAEMHVDPKLATITIEDNTPPTRRSLTVKDVLESQGMSVVMEKPGERTFFKAKAAPSPQPGAETPYDAQNNVAMHKYLAAHKNAVDGLYDTMRRLSRHYAKASLPGAMDCNMFIDAFFKEQLLGSSPAEINEKVVDKTKFHLEHDTTFPKAITSFSATTRSGYTFKGGSINSVQDWQDRFRERKPLPWVISIQNPKGETIEKLIFKRVENSCELQNMQVLNRFTGKYIHFKEEDCKDAQKIAMQMNNNVPVRKKNRNPVVVAALTVCRPAYAQYFKAHGRAERLIAPSERDGLDGLLLGGRPDSYGTKAY